ncbi:MAG TPA: PLP-dependent aminotransferase family protein [Gemmatimonadales bacterium]|nr:PLP-dependent aminotransferase family protein [Gemmatimonadales bacterium]
MRPSAALSLPQPRDGTPAWRWLCAALRAEILEGRLRPGDRLPATRGLARQHGLSRGTIVAAFRQLEAEGYVAGSRGSGTYVSQVLPDDLLQVPRRSSVAPPARANLRRNLSTFAGRVIGFPGFSVRPTRAFRCDLPALDLFPTTLWAQVAGRRLRGATLDLLLGCGPLGYIPLRRAVADYLRTSRGVRCEAEQIVIVSGAQEALDLVARVFVNPGDRVAVEDPGYPGAALLFHALGARVVPVPLDDEGMQVPAARVRGARLAYVTPAHQFPTGIGMTLRRRLALLEWARAGGTVIVEDDYDSEYRYAGRPMPALQGLDRHGLVLFVGSFSKVLFPSLRLGYLVIPPDLIDRFEAIRSVTSRHASLVEQAVLCDFITEGHFGRHVRRMRAIYAERLGVLLETARTRLTGMLELSSVEAGLQTTAWLAPGIDAEQVAAAAGQRDVDVVPLGRYQRRPAPAAPQGLQLGFAAVDGHEIRRGVRELVQVLESIRPAGDP